MLNIIVKNLILSSGIVLGLSLTSHGQTTDILPKKIFNRSSSLLQPEVQQISQVTRPRRRTRTRRSRREKKFYYGLGVGIFLPEEVALNNDDFLDDASADFSNGFSLNAFGGYRLSKYFSGELELSGAFGSVEFNNVPNEELINDLDLDYSVFAVYLTPRVEVPLLEDKFKLYAAPGIGFSGVSTDNDRDFDGDGEEDNLTNDSGFSYQLKAGAAYNISEKISIFGQARYNSFFLENADNLTGTTFEIGASF